METTITEDFDFQIGMELKDIEGGDLRYVIEDFDKVSEVHLSGYSDFCMCESWYTPEEIAQRFVFTGNIIDLKDIGEGHFITCECEDKDA